MSNQENNLLCRWFEEVWNKGRLEAVDELAAPGFVAHGLTDEAGNTVTGRDAFKAFWRRLRESFPDVQITVEDGLVDGDKVMVRCTVQATHSGAGNGAAPAQTPVTFSGMCVGRVKDGQLIEGWNTFDFLSMYQQLGVVPESLA
jgi:predicted ester cyclase